MGSVERYKDYKINMKPLYLRPGLNYYEKNTINISVEGTTIQRLIYITKIK